MPKPSVLVEEENSSQGQDKNAVLVSGKTFSDYLHWSSRHSQDSGFAEKIVCVFD